MGQYDDDWRSTAVVATVSLVPKTSVDPATLDSWAEQFRMWYREHRSAGAHTGIRLMLLKWGHDEYVSEVDASPEFRNSTDNRNWYMNSQGMQMNIVRGPVEFWFGSSPTARDPGSVHRIDYSFAYSDQVVSEVQYARFRPDRFADPKHRPAIGINFFDSIAYCDWLSAQEGLASGESVRWIDEKKYELNFLDGGYRPPTVWEWECLVRAGTSSSFEFGEVDAEYVKARGFLWQSGCNPMGPASWDQTSMTINEWSSTNARSIRSAIASRGEFDALFHTYLQKSCSENRSVNKLLRPNLQTDSSFRLCFPNFK